MPDKQYQLLLVEDNPGDARLVREMLAGSDSVAFSIQSVDSLVEALDALTRGRFDVALVDLSLPDSQGLETLLTIQQHAPSLPIVLLTGLDSESMALDAVKHGAQDYLVKGTLTPETLIRALRYATVRGDKSSESKSAAAKATIIGVLGSKGGVGTTTIASHQAFELSRLTGKKTLLLDLDASGVSATFLLKLRSEYTILDATKSLHRLDLDLWKGFICQAAEGVDVLQAPGVAGNGEELSPDRVRHLLRFARSWYGWIVVDLGRLNALSLNLLEEMTDLFVVSTRELPSLYEAGRLLTRLMELGLTREHTRLLLNRATKSANCSVDDLASALEYPVYAALADCSSELDEAFAQGRFLDDKLRLRSQVRQFVGKYLGVEEKRPVRTGLSFFRFARA